MSGGGQETSERTYMVGSVTVGMPSAMLSSDVFDPPNGKGTSATSASANRAMKGM